ncbi:uncharacterized protein ACNS7B_002902 [Menidia menidia]
MKFLLVLTLMSLAEFDYQRRAAHSCPDLCSCSFSSSGADVVCSLGSLKHFPVTNLPSNTSKLSIQSSNVSSITEDDLKAVPLLNYLQLYHTKLSNLPSQLLSAVPRLNTLDLTGNQLADLPANIFSHSSLRSLVMKGNQFERAEPSWFPVNSSLTWLDLSGNHLSCIPAALLQRLPRLENLDLSDNNLQAIQVNSLKNLHHLETLNLAGNKLVSLAPATFAHNRELKQLFLQENQLKELPAGLLRGLTHLDLLLLNQNLLPHLPSGLLDGRKPSFQAILTGNPWECDFQIEYLRRWLTVHPQNVLFLEDVTCFSPETVKHQPVVSLTERQLGVKSHKDMNMEK